MHGSLTVGGEDILSIPAIFHSNEAFVSLRFKTDNLWTYFDDLHPDEIPSFEMLYDMAVALWNNYSNPGAFTSFVTGRHLDHSVVPIGELWRDEEDTDREPVPSQAADNSAEGMKSGESGENEKSKGMEEGGTISVGGEKLRGDHTLARSASFMYEALVSKEVAQAVAEGDIGRVYEGIKVSFLFSHNTGF